MTEIKFTTTINLLDAADLRQHAEDVTEPGFITDATNIEQVIYTAVVNPGPNPLGHPYERLTGEVTKAEGDNLFNVTVSLRVTDGERLIASARDAYYACFQDFEWYPETFCEAAYELLIASNNSPAPVDIGFEIMRTTYAVDEPTPKAPSQAL